MTRHQETARAVAAQLYRTEHVLDEAIREAARLTLGVADASGELNLAAEVGGEVFDRAAALHAGLAAARAQAVALHGALATVRDRLRIRMDGPDFGTPVKPPTGALAEGEAEPAARRLRSV